MNTVFTITRHRYALPLLLAAALAGCATPDAQYPWPERVVEANASDVAGLTSGLFLKPAGLKRSIRTIVVRAHVDEAGSVQRVAVVQSSGVPELDTAALRSVAIAKFKPPLRDGQPEPATVIVPLRGTY